MQESNLRTVSEGIVAQDKNDGSKFILVYPKEQLPFHEGEVSGGFTRIERKGVDANNVAYNVNLHKTMAVKAEWIGDGNRITAPNVRKGETVHLYEMAGTGRYYWQETGRDNHLRRGEAITWAFSASGSPVETNEPISAHNAYVMTIDGKKGHATLTTSQHNGEKAGYSVQINGKKGHLTVTDQDGNVVQINTVTGVITAKNKAGTFVTLNKKNLAAYAAETINLKSPKITLDGDTTITGTLTVNKETTLKAKLTAQEATFTKVFTPIINSNSHSH